MSLYVGRNTYGHRVQETPDVRRYRFPFCDRYHTTPVEIINTCLETEDSPQLFRMTDMVEGQGYRSPDDPLHPTDGLQPPQARKGCMSSLPLRVFSIPISNPGPFVVSLPHIPGTPWRKCLQLYPVAEISVGGHGHRPPPPFRQPWIPTWKSAVQER